jgi:parallel beta-helix repeat protein
VTESVFSWPGTGLLAIDAVRARDYQVVQAVVIVFSAIFIMTNLLVDILYLRGNIMRYGTTVTTKGVCDGICRQVLRGSTIAALPAGGGPQGPASQRRVLSIRSGLERAIMGHPRRFFAIAAFAAVLTLGLGLVPGQASAQPIPVSCSNTNFGTVILDDQFANQSGFGSGPLTFVLQGTCLVNVIIRLDDVTITTSGAATVQASDPNQTVILLDGAQRVVINGLSVSGGTYGVSATRGATGSLTNCDISGGTINAVISSYGSTLEIDNCVIHNNFRGAVAANNASLIVTNTTSRDNANEGLLAIRSSYLRVGQDRGGSLVARPVTVNNNGTHGVSIVDSSTANIVASNIHHNGNNGVLFQRGSSGEVGMGSNNLVSPNTIQNNTGTGVTVYQSSAALIQGNTLNANSRGVFVGTSSATIIGNSIQNNTGRGVQVVEKGSARIGVVDPATSTLGNTISGNTSDGVGIFDGGEGVVAGNTISSNGGHGIAMNMGTLNLVGGNTISQNVSHGISVSASRIFQAPGTFGTLPDTADVSQGNGLAGMFLFNNSSADLYRITLTGNARQGIGASLNSTINLHVYDAARPNNLISITGNGTANVANNNDGITLFSASMLLSPQNPGGPGQVVITGHPGWGVNCFGTTNKAAASLDTTGISANTAGTVNCGGF